MKLIVSLSLIASVSAFAPAAVVSQKSSALQAAAQQQSRSEFLAAAVTSAAATALVLAPPQAALAAKYGGFGAGSPEVLNPAEADIDRDVLNSGPVQSALKKVQGYKAAVTSMETALAADAQANVRGVILKELDFADLRASLNTVNAIFEEDTQRGTDRLIRVIIQDITELEVANALKDGKPRSQRRVEIMQGKLAKLSTAFDDFCAFAQ